MIIRPATREDLASVDGQAPTRTCRAQAVIEDGKCIAVWGVYVMNTRRVLFANFTPAFRKSRRNFVVGIKALKQFLAEGPDLPILSRADPEIPGSDVLLEHIGFEHLHGRLYQWHGCR